MFRVRKNRFLNYYNTKLAEIKFYLGIMIENS